MTTNWYWRRVRKNLNRVVRACEDILPANRASVYKYLQWGIFESIDGVLAGLRGADEWDSIEDWNKHEVFSKFQKYVHKEERRLKTILCELSYGIDQDKTLNLLTRKGRLEKVCMNLLSFITIYYANMTCKYALPLLCLLLERVAWTVDVARNKLVSPKEFSLLYVSIATVVDGMRTRANELQGQVWRNISTIYLH